MKNLLNEFSKLNNKGAKFIALHCYLSKTSGEISNYVINTGVNITNAKKGDLRRLQACTELDLLDIQNKTNIAMETIKTALSELIASAEKNLSEKLDERSKQSQAQTDAYITLYPAIKLHKETMALHIFGQAVSKEVLVKGEYKLVNSSDKTIAKNAIKKHLKLRSDKFRNFILENTPVIVENGRTLILDLKA